MKFANWLAGRKNETPSRALRDESFVSPTVTKPFNRLQKKWRLSIYLYFLYLWYSISHPIVN